MPLFFLFSTGHAFSDKIEFVVQKPMTIYFNQVKRQQGMRSLYFQNGETFTADMPMKWDLPWCGLQVGLKLDENVQLDKGLVLTPESYYVDQNQKDQITYTWSFVAASDKKVKTYAKFSPFVFQCSVGRGLKLSPGIFETIVGKYIKTQEIVVENQKAEESHGTQKNQGQ